MLVIHLMKHWTRVGENDMNARLIVFTLRLLLA